MARKRGMQYIPYDYEAAYNKAMEDMHEWFIENLFQHRKKVIYALKEITAGDQFEIEIYPQFRSMDEVPPEGRTIKKDNNKARLHTSPAGRRTRIPQGHHSPSPRTWYQTPCICPRCSLLSVSSSPDSASLPLASSPVFPPAAPVL